MALNPAAPEFVPVSNNGRFRNAIPTPVLGYLVPFHYYQPIPPSHLAGNVIPPPPPPPATQHHRRQMCVPGMVVTHRSFGRRRSRSIWVKKGEKERSGAKYGARTWPHPRKYQVVELAKKERDTTVMIKNIPYDYTPTMLVEFMDEFCKMENERDKSLSTAYDFLYLPMDFQSNKNKGYAFVNFTSSESAWNFFNAYNRTNWDPTPSSKIRIIVRARIQGKDALIAHFQKSRFECDTVEFLPRSFDPARNGSGGKVRVTLVGTRRHRYHKQ